MRNHALIALCVIVSLIAVIKLAAPGTSERVWKMLGLPGRDGGFIEVFRTSERTKTEKTEEMSEPEPDADLVVPEELHYRIEEAVIAGEFAHAAEIPEAVSIFLNSQEAFMDYGFPENVDYTVQELPFEYAIPVAGCSSSGFGYRIHPIQNEVKFHYGTDFAANAGENIAAFADGTVLFAGSSDSFGNYITIDHGDGWTTLYAHCSYLYVHSGQSVTSGEKIALVGATGHVTGPHLHFELRHNGIYLNPEYYINA